MRSSPLLLLAVVALGFALIAVPLARLTWANDRAAGTSAAAAEPAAPTGGATESVPALLVVRYAHAPLRVVVRVGEEVAATFGPPGPEAGGQMEQSIRLAVPSDGFLDVLVEAQWPDGTPPTALGLELEPDGLETRRATLWSDVPTVSEVLGFSWK